MKTRTEYWIEWVDGAAMERDYPAEARKGGFTAEDIAKGEGFLDCCPPECYMQRRRFPSRATALGWAQKNTALDLWKSPRLLVIEVTEHIDYDDSEEVERWEISDDAEPFPNHLH